MARKERERERDRLAILEAGETVFGREGLYAATVERIAKEAGFAVETLCSFFKGKEDLYGEVVRKNVREFMALLEERVLVEANPGEAISALIKLRLEHFDRHHSFFRVFFETSPGSRVGQARDLPEDCVKLYDRYLEIVSDVFRGAIAAGQVEVEAPDTLYLALLLETILKTSMGFWSRKDSVEPIEPRVEKVKNLLLSCMREGSNATDRSAKNQSRDPENGIGP